MGLIDWLRGLFGQPRRVTRDVSRSTDHTDASATAETVSTKREPIKPNHRRLTVRDPRLLPKKEPKRTGNIWSTSKKKKLMQREEADRLFSSTMRTNNRNIRDLATDKEQLNRYNLPVWQSEQDVAQALGLTVGQLRHYSIHRERETSPHYICFAIRKHSGGTRIIHAPKQKLKAIQRKLNVLLVSKLPISEHAHGFITSRSVASNAAAHVGKEVVVRIDLKDCFPSIHFGRVRGLLIAYGYSYPVATTLAVLMTESERQPVEAEGKVYHVPVGPRVCVQGAPTSPGLCNAILLRLDRRLAGLARKMGYTYTRYADDLTFSCNSADVGALLSVVGDIVKEEGFTVNRDKTQVQRRGRRQRVTGVVVNEQMGLSRKDRRLLRAAIHRQKQQGDNVDPKERQRLAGKLAYLKMLNADQAAPLIARFKGE